MIKAISLPLQSMLYNFLAIEGTLGAGKTTLATRIANDFNGKLILEQFEDNPFLPKFYKEPDKYAFPLEMTFMASRYQQMKDQISTYDMFHDFIVSDYFIVKSLIFSHNNLEEDEYRLFTRFFNITMGNIHKPDLLVYLYLDVDNLQSNIRKRGRSYEQEIKESYLTNIQAGYFDYFRQVSDMRILILDTNKLDFVKNEKDYQLIIDTIDRPYDIGVHRISF